MFHCLIIRECLHLHDKLYFSEASAISIIFLPFPTLDGISFDTDSFYLHVRSFASKDSLLKNFGNFWISSGFLLDFFWIFFRLLTLHLISFSIKKLRFSPSTVCFKSVTFRFKCFVSKASTHPLFS